MTTGFAAGFAVVVEEPDFATDAYVVGLRAILAEPDG